MNGWNHLYLNVSLHYQMHEAGAASQRGSPLRGHRHTHHSLPGDGTGWGRWPLRLHPPPRGRCGRGHRQASLRPDCACCVLLPPAARSAPGPEAWERGFLPSARRRQAHWLWVQQLIPARDDAGHQLWVAGIFCSWDSAGRRVRCSGCGWDREFFFSFLYLRVVILFCFLSTELEIRDFKAARQTRTKGGKHKMQISLI